MSAYTPLDDMFEVADQFGEAQVLRDVAARAGWLWACANPRCARDNIGRSAACEFCSWPAPEPELDVGEWRCACQRVNTRLDDTCPICHRENPHFRRS